jgi:excisionase family DNA binding protein
VDWATSVNLDDRITQLVRDALEPMLAERFRDLEDRLTEKLSGVIGCQEAPAPSLLTQKEVAKYLRVAPRTLQRMVAAGEFPPPVQVSPGRKRWRQADVEAGP